MTGPVVTRFAPSPTGYLHLGHAFSALVAEAAARESGGRFLVRMEDIDGGRCRPEFEEAIYEDLRWLGLEWETPERRQSDHMADYARALERLTGRGVLYPCFCTRKEIRAEREAMDGAPHGFPGGMGILYPGTCRRLSSAERRRRIDDGAPYVLRLEAEKAMSMSAGAPLIWHDRDAGDVACDLGGLGDVVVARKAVPTSYHLAVTVDDHLQGVTLVTRGRDLFAATHVHRLLQALLGLDVPAYHHHRLIEGADGRRLAKRDAGLTIRALRQAGKTPDAVRAMCGFDHSAA